MMMRWLALVLALLCAPAYGYKYQCIPTLDASAVASDGFTRDDDGWRASWLCQRPNGVVLPSVFACVHGTCLESQLTNLWRVMGTEMTTDAQRRGALNFATQSMTDCSVGTGALKTLCDRAMQRGWDLTAIWYAAQPYPPVGSEWRQEAVDGATFDVGAQWMIATRYGTDGAWIGKRTTGVVTCSAATFGADPKPGAAKSCWTLRVAAPQPPPLAEVWKVAPNGTTTTRPTYTIANGALVTDAARAPVLTNGAPTPCAPAHTKGTSVYGYWDAAKTTVTLCRKAA